MLHIFCLTMGLVIITTFPVCCRAVENTTTHNGSITDQGVTLRVLWTVSAYHLGTKATEGEKEARSMLFKPLDINGTTITFDGKSCSDVVFHSKSVDADQYFLEHHTTTQALGLDVKNIEVITTNCFLPGFSEYIRLKDRRILIFINGIFYFLEPVINY